MTTRMEAHMTATIRTKFVSAFDEETAAAIEAAANEHANGTNSENKGTDPFKWALLIVIGYECASKNSYREYHGIKAEWSLLKAWIKEHADLASHDGDCDYLAMLAGAYNEFMPKKVA
jgi:phosphomannomutase